MALSVAPIPRLLAEESGALEGFVDLLRREQELLAEGDIETLSSLAVEKAAMAERLGRLSLQREDSVAADGCKDMNAWLARSENHSHETAWQQLLDLARQAKTLNETNGSLIKLRLQHNQQALAVLLAASNLAVTYGPDGQQYTAGNGRPLGSA